MRLTNPNYSAMKNLKKLTREAQKAIVGKGVQSCPPTGGVLIFI